MHDVKTLILKAKLWKKLKHSSLQYNRLDWMSQKYTNILDFYVK